MSASTMGRSCAILTKKMDKPTRLTRPSPSATRNKKICGDTAFRFSTVARIWRQLTKSDTGSDDPHRASDATETRRQDDRHFCHAIRQVAPESTRPHVSLRKKMCRILRRCTLIGQSTHRFITAGVISAYRRRVVPTQWRAQKMLIQNEQSD